MKACNGAFKIDASTRIAIDDAPESLAIGERLARWLGLPHSAVEILPASAPDPSSGIALRLSRSDTAAMAREPHDPATRPPRTAEEEAYALDVSATRALVRARRPSGLFYGSQTLAQLASARRIGMETPRLARSGWTVPCLAIEDAPRFSFRAMHLDVARHFFSREVVERYIDLLAFYRFNVFHWHLTDDQGFRLELKRHPELAAIGGRDGFYTQEDVRAVVEYARQRSITVVPEIEMPGHARAILAAHPELSCTGKKQEVPRTWGVFEDVLCAGNEETYALLGEILDEVATLFPASLVHVGGDEVPTTRWSACAKCRAAMRTSSVSAGGLHAVFMQRVGAMLGRLGKRPLVWDEALEALAQSGATSPLQDPVIVAWQSSERGRESAQRGFDVVMAPHEHVYFNVHQSQLEGEPGHEGFLPWAKVRSFDPIPVGFAPARAARILGAEGALWTEHISSPEDIDTMVMPRLAALAETLWSGPAPTEQDFVARFGAQLPALDRSKVGYFVEPPTGLPARKVFVDPETVTVMSAPPALFPFGVVRWTSDGSEPTAASRSFDAPIVIRDTTTIAAALLLPNGRTSTTVRSSIVKERHRPALEVASTREGAVYTYAEGDFHQLPNFDKLRATARGRVPAISLSAVSSVLGAKMKKEHFAVLFEGFVRVPSDGVHRFVARADDGVRIDVDGEKILEDDGEHAPRDSSGEIALSRGLHRIRVSYFQGSEGKELDVKIESPGLRLGPLEMVTDAAPKTSRPAP